MHRCYGGQGTDGRHSDGLDARNHKDSGRPAARILRCFILQIMRRLTSEVSLPHRRRC